MCCSAFDYDMPNYHEDFIPNKSIKYFYQTCGYCNNLLCIGKQLHIADKHNYIDSCMYIRYVIDVPFRSELIAQ
jgi:hypothetical protein